MPSNPNELKKLAKYLLEQQDSILEEWKQVMEESVEQSSKLVSLSREKFYNHIPIVLDSLSKNLRNEETDERAGGKEHGAERWEYGHDLRALMREWSKLHLILVDRVNQAQKILSLSADSLSRAQKKVSEHTHNGIVDSVDKYYQLNHRKAEARMRDLQKAIQQKDDDKTYLRRTSHDLKGSLYALRMGFFLLEDEELSDKTAEIIDRMALAADSLEELLNDLLDLFRLEAGKEKVTATEFDAAELLNNLCDSMQPLAQDEELDLRCSGDDTLAVKTDRTKVQRIAQNLLLNSLKYTKTGHVEMNWKLESDEHWLLHICDTGPGLANTTAASVTTQADSSESSQPERPASPDKDNDSPAVQSHGEGIGLLIVQHLCELMNGVIETKTSPDSGTTFRIVLPVDVTQ